MRKMSFKSFLLKYAQELTGSTTTSLKKLLDLSLNNHARAFEPIALLFFLRGKGSSVWDQTENTSHKESVQYLLDRVTDESSLINLLAEESIGKDFLIRYKKVYQAYLSYVNKLDTDREASLLMREKMLTIMRSKGMSNYRVYTDLSLNPGNVNAFLKNGDASKISRKTARKMLEFVQTA